MKSTSAILIIMELVRKGSLQPEDAALQIKAIFSDIVEDSSAGIGSVDATEMWDGITQAIDKL